MESLYKTLRDTCILEADNISSDLELSQDGIAHKVKGEDVSLHIDQDPSSLRVYLPRNKDDQEYIFVNLLPERLFEWMMAHLGTAEPEDVDKKGVEVIRCILCSPRSKLATTLKYNGIITLHIADLDPVDEPPPPMTPARESIGSAENSSPSGEGDDHPSALETPATSVASPPLSLSNAVSSSEISIFHSSRYSSTWRDPFTSPTSHPAYTTTHALYRDFQYALLLEKVIASARTASIPTHGASSTLEVRPSLYSIDYGTDFGLRTTSQFERDCKIGAAGELYVSLLA
jgi:hypothetical protein